MLLVVGNEWADSAEQHHASSVAGSFLNSITHLSLVVFTSKGNTLRK